MVTMLPAEVMDAAKTADAHTADALAAAQEAVKSLVALKGMSIFGTSPAGKSTDQVFGQASTVIDELITEVNQAITVLNQNLHASVDAVLKDQEVAQVDYTKLTKDNKNRSTTIDTTGLKPGDPGYVAPTASQGYNNGPAGSTDGSPSGQSDETGTSGDQTGGTSGTPSGGTAGSTGGSGGAS